MSCAVAYSQITCTPSLAYPIKIPTYDVPRQIEPETCREEVVEFFSGGEGAQLQAPSVFDAFDELLVFLLNDALKAQALANVAYIQDDGRLFGHFGDAGADLYGYFFSGCALEHQLRRDGAPLFPSIGYEFSAAEQRLWGTEIRKRPSYHCFWRITQQALYGRIDIEHLPRRGVHRQNYIMGPLYKGRKRNCVAACTEEPA